MAKTQTVPGSSRALVLVASLSAAGIALLLPLPEGMPEPARRAAVVGILMAVMWVFEVMPLAATALVPIVAFPMLGVANVDVVAQSYSNPIVFLFLGGFMLAAAMQRWELHRHLALAAVGVAGRNQRSIILAMMAATAFISLWVSNTATAMVMVPIAAALLASMHTGSGDRRQLDERGAHSTPAAIEPPDDFRPALMLGIAFAATIGGMGSLIGTPPNALLAAFISKTYGITIGFGQWMLIGIPIVLLLIPTTWLMLTRVTFHVPDAELPAGALIEPRGRLERGGRIVAAVLVATAASFILRPWLAEVLGIRGLSDAGIAIAAALLLFMMPQRFSGGRTLLDWKDVGGIRWDVLILFGGGLALADVIGSSGLAAWIGGSIEGLSDLPFPLLVLVLMATVVYLGELASNTAIAAIFLPVAGAAAVGLGAHPLLLTLPVALAASLGFMLPVATPPNAIVFGTDEVTSRQMLRAGSVLDVVSIIIVYAVAMLLAPLVFGLPSASAG